MVKYLDPDLRASGVAEAWKTQYKNEFTGEWRNIIRGSSFDVYQKLVELGSNPDPDDIEDVIGNDSWTMTECDECGTTNCPVALFSTYHEDVNFSLCLECLRKTSHELWSRYYE